MVGQIIETHACTAGAQKILALTSGDDHDAIAASALGRLDHEALVRLQRLLQGDDFVLDADLVIQRRHRNTGVHGQLFGAQFVVNQGVQTARVETGDVQAVALVHADDAGLAQAGPGPHHAAHHGFIQTERKRHSSVSR